GAVGRETRRARLADARAAAGDQDRVPLEPSARRRGSQHSRVLSEVGYRRFRNVARTSSTNAAGSSAGAKCPPESRVLAKTRLSGSGRGWESCGMSGRKLV